MKLEKNSQFNLKNLKVEVSLINSWKLVVGTLQLEH